MASRDRQIQYATLLNWCNVYLPADHQATDIGTSFRDGTLLMHLIAGLQHTTAAPRKPETSEDEIASIQEALGQIHRAGVGYPIPTAAAIHSGDREAIASLLWSLVVHFDVRRVRGGTDDRSKSPQTLLLEWVVGQLPERDINNFTSEWQDGKLLYALVRAIEPNALSSKIPGDARSTARMAIDAARERLGVPAVISAEDLVSGHMDNISMMTYIACFRKGLTPFSGSQFPGPAPVPLVEAPVAESARREGMAGTRAGPMRRGLDREPSGYMESSFHAEQQPPTRPSGYETIPDHVAARPDPATYSTIDESRADASMPAAPAQDMRGPPVPHDRVPSRRPSQEPRQGQGQPPTWQGQSQGHGQEQGQGQPPTWQGQGHGQDPRYSVAYSQPPAAPSWQGPTQSSARAAPFDQEFDEAVDIRPQAQSYHHREHEYEYDASIPAGRERYGAYPAPAYTQPGGYRHHSTYHHSYQGARGGGDYGAASHTRTGGSAAHTYGQSHARYSRDAHASAPMSQVYGGQQHAARSYQARSARGYDQASGRRDYSGAYETGTQARAMPSAAGGSALGPSTPYIEYEVGLPGWDGEWTTPFLGSISARTFAVNLSPSSSSRRFGLQGPLWLQINMDYVVLVDRNTNALVMQWPLNHVKRFGKDIGLFSLEVGHLDPSAGVFYFHTEQADDAFAVISRYLQAW